MTKRINPAFDSRTIPRTHCPKGHPYDEANTGRRLKGGKRIGLRYCRECNRQWSRKADQRRRLDDPERVRFNHKQRVRRWMQSPANRLKNAAWRAAWHQRHKDWSHVRNTLSRYSLTLDQYHALFERADFACQICGTDDQRLGIDHCHETGRVRGVLCNSCNAAVGHLRQDPARVKATLAYVETRC